MIVMIVQANIICGALSLVIQEKLRPDQNRRPQRPESEDDERRDGVVISDLTGLVVAVLLHPGQVVLHDAVNLAALVKSLDEMRE